MKLTKKQKHEILKMFTVVDVKKLELDHPDPEKVKWFRFGAHTAMGIASEIINSIEEEPAGVSNTKIS